MIVLSAYCDHTKGPCFSVSVRLKCWWPSFSINEWKSFWTLHFSDMESPVLRVLVKIVSLEALYGSGRLRLMCQTFQERFRTNQVFCWNLRRRRCIPKIHPLRHRRSILYNNTVQKDLSGEYELESLETVIYRQSHAKITTWKSLGFFFYMSLSKMLTFLPNVKLIHCSIFSPII